MITGGSGIYLRSGTSGSVVNYGSIAGTTSDGVVLGSGGTVSNEAGGAISGRSVGVAVYGAAATVTNAGTISGPGYALKFASGFANRLIVAPGALFNGAVDGGGSLSTLELASGGSGTITGINNGTFLNFGAVQSDAGSTWTFVGPNTVSDVVDHGRIDVSGSFDVTGAVDSASDGMFNLAGSARLELAGAIGTDFKISFAPSSSLVIDTAAQFGVDVGSALYGGPLLQSFGAGATIDLRDISASGVALNFDGTNGLLQVSNSNGQHATLRLDTATLGPGLLAGSADGSSGTMITLI